MKFNGKCEAVKNFVALYRSEAGFADREFQPWLWKDLRLNQALATRTAAECLMRRALMSDI